MTLFGPHRGCVARYLLPSSAIVSRVRCHLRQYRFVLELYWAILSALIPPSSPRPTPLKGCRGRGKPHPAGDDGGFGRANIHQSEGAERSYTVPGCVAEVCFRDADSCCCLLFVCCCCRRPPRDPPRDPPATHPATDPPRDPPRDPSLLSAIAGCYVMSGIGDVTPQPRLQF